MEALASNGGLGVRELAERFGVSEMTIRRDLDYLERRGELTRTHGGAVLSKPGVVEFEFARKSREYAAEKRAIAKAAVRWIEPGMTLTLDTGTTTLEVARLLPEIGRLTVLTSSLPIASALHAFDRIELVLLGGVARKGDPDLTGWLTEENLKRFRVDLAVLGADGLMPDGAYTTDMGVARVSRAILAGSARNFLVADRGKMGKSAFVNFAALNAFERVITDGGAAPPVREWLEAGAKHVTYAERRAEPRRGEGE